MNVQISREMVEQPIRDFSGECISVSQSIEQCNGRVRDYIRMLVKDRYLADDLCQETFIKIMRETSAGRYNESGKFLSWALRIAHNVVIDHFRSTRRNIEINEREAGFDMFSSLNVVESSAESALMSEQTGEKLHALIDSLPEEQREVIRLKYFDDLTFREIAERTGVSINTALGRMRYALINLRKIVSGMNDFLCMEQ